MPLQARRQRIRYSDFKINMTEHPVHGDLVLNTDGDSVIRSVKNLCFTDRYERPWSPTMGAGLKAYLFEPISSVTGGIIRKRIIETIERYEPRAELLEVIVAVQPDQNQYTAKIIFKILNDPDPIDLDVILTRIR